MGVTAPPSGSYLHLQNSWGQSWHYGFGPIAPPARRRPGAGSIGGSDFAGVVVALGSDVPASHPAIHIGDRLCYGAMGRLGGVYVGLELLPDAKPARQLVTSSWVMGQEVATVHIRYRPGPIQVYEPL
ncbi:hypothetical protein GGS20DRAFT_589638 [Poronia punctata]|nr:hypothetical protein GGS20DRAFT_589638 [Poronia punctata]